MTVFRLLFSWLLSTHNCCCPGSQVLWSLREGADAPGMLGQALLSFPVGMGTLSGLGVQLHLEIQKPQWLDLPSDQQLLLFSSEGRVSPRMMGNRTSTMGTGCAGMYQVGEHREDTTLAAAFCASNFGWNCGLVSPQRGTGQGRLCLWDLKQAPQGASALCASPPSPGAPLWLSSHLIHNSNILKSAEKTVWGIWSLQPRGGVRFSSEKGKAHMKHVMSLIQQFHEVLLQKGKWQSFHMFGDLQRQGSNGSLCSGLEILLYIGSF